jgi:uncharacterized damage-inducible protein DinB
MKQFFDHWDDVQDVTLKLLKQIPEDKLDYKPVPEVFSIKELVVHIFDSEKAFVDSSLTGEMKMEMFATNSKEKIKTTEDLYNLAKSVHDELDAKIATMSEEELMKPLVTPWGTLPVFVHMNSAYEHMWHHRGQLYTYLRLIGVKPVFVFSYPGVPAAVAE